MRASKTADQSRIFDEFVRLQSPAQRHKPDMPSGLGLGLSIVKRLAALLQVRIDVRSTPNRGSAFGILDLSISAEQAAVNRAESQPAHNAFSGALVQIIDDDDDTLEATAALLRKWGYRVVTQREPVALEQSPDVIISDYALENSINGITAIETLRRNSDDYIFAVLISGSVDAELSARAKAAGLPCLHKPVRPAQLRSLLLSGLAGARM